MRCHLIGGAIALLAACLPLAAGAQPRTDYPSRAVRLLIPFPAGGTTDATTRTLASSLEGAWKQPVLVENQPGGFSMIASGNVARSAPDGHTLLVAVHSITYEHLLNKDVTFNAARDLTPIGLIAGSGLVYTVNAAVPAKSLAEFVAYAKANPGKLNEGIGGSTVISELVDFWPSLGAEIVAVPYKGGAAAVTALVAGDVQIYGASPLDVLVLSKAGKVRPLFYSDRQRHPQFPDIPTLQDLGSKFQYRFWFGLWGPANLPADIVAKVSATLRDSLRSPQVRERFENLGLQIYAGSPEEFRAETAGRVKAIEELLAKGYKLR